MQKQIGYVLCGSDNGISYYEGAPQGVLCQRCHTPIDRKYAPKGLAFKRSLDYSVTNDLQDIASRRFLNLIKVLAKGKICSIQVGSEPDMFVFWPTNVVKFDVVSRQTRFNKFCPVCHNYEQIAGATPAFLKDCHQLAGISRTDIVFGSGSHKNSLIILSASVKNEIEQERFTDVYFKPALIA